MDWVSLSFPQVIVVYVVGLLINAVGFMNLSNGLVIKIQVFRNHCAGLIELCTNQWGQTPLIL
jgi:hypothetical protein